PYTFTVTATNVAGVGAASNASNEVTPAGPKSISFPAIPTQTFGTSLDVAGLGITAGSGLAVTLSSDTPSVCTLESGTVLVYVATGSCTINANQAGNNEFLPAAEVGRTFSVVPVVPGAPGSVEATAGEAQASVAFAAPTFTGG